MKCLNLKFILVDKKESTPVEQNANDASPRLSKRAKLIEQKLKTKQSTSLFDTDGDLNRCNIIEGARRSRNRTSSNEPSQQQPASSQIQKSKTLETPLSPTLTKPRGKPGPKPKAKPGPKPGSKPVPKPQPNPATTTIKSKPGPKPGPKAKPGPKGKPGPKPGPKLIEGRPKGKPGPKPKLKTKQLIKETLNEEQNRQKRKRTNPPAVVKRVPTMPLYKNARQKLLPKPRSSLDMEKNDLISQRLARMEKLQKDHDKAVKELYHLELFQNMLEYKPNAFINDVRYNKVKFKN